MQLADANDIARYIGNGVMRSSSGRRLEFACFSLQLNMSKCLEWSFSTLSRMLMREGVVVAHAT